MRPVVRRAVVWSANLPFAAAVVVALDNEALGTSLLMDRAALPLFLMGIFVAWIATIVLLHGYMIGDQPPTG